LSEYAQLARALDAGAPALEKLRLTLLSTYTTEVLDPLLRVESARHGFALEIRHGGFGQLEQALLSDPGRSGDGAPEALLLAMRLEDLQPDLPYRFYSDPEGFERLSEDVIGRIVEVVSLFRERSSGVALVANFAPPEPRPL